MRVDIVDFPALRNSHGSTGARAAFLAGGLSPSLAIQFTKRLEIRHSEERSDEESLFLLATIQKGFLAPLGMTALGALTV
jgi:hypothetical protein